MLLMLKHREKQKRSQQTQTSVDSKNKMLERINMSWARVYWHKAKCMM